MLYHQLLNTFPQLLSYGFGSYFFAPLILRVAAAVVFLYLAYWHYRHKDEIGSISFPVIGKAAWVGLLSVVVEGAVGVGLFLGAYTQIAAIVGALIALKQFVWANKYTTYFILSRVASLLLLAITFTLLITGAGAHAFDVPL